MRHIFARRSSRSDDLAALQLLERAAVVANESATCAEAAGAILDEVCAYTGWPVGHAYLVDRDDPDILRSSGVWHLDHPRRYEAFKVVTEATPLRRGEGLPGRVLASGRPEWIRDVTSDDNFPRARGTEIEVRGAFAMPVLIGREVVGVLEFFADKPQEPDKRLLELMAHVGTQLGRVAERERASAAVQDQVAYASQLIESAYDAFVSIDHIGRITGWNHAAEAMFGWTSEEVLNRPLAATIIPKEYRDRHLSGVARYLATGEATVLNRRIELSAVHRDGHTFPIELAIWPVNSGGKTMFCAFIHDITARQEMVSELKAADEASRSSAERLVVAQQMAGVGSWEWDIDRNIVTWSDQLYRNFELSPEDFRPSFDAYMGLVHPEDRAIVAATVTNALDKMGSFEYDHRTVLGSGEVRVHHCTGQVVVSEGRVITMAGTNQDVTKRREAEQDIRAAYERERETVDRLRELDEAKTEFMSSVTHELRTPLTSIIGYLEFLLTTGREITDEHKEMLDIVERNSHRLLLLIDDLLTQSRLQSGTFRLSLEPTAVAPIIDRSVQAMLPVAVENDLALEVVVAPDVGSVMGDADQLERALLNLLSNAMKFTNEGSVRVEATREGSDIVISVSDTGIGIAPSEIDSLFDAFVRTPAAEQYAPGTGLGLTIVRSITEQHGGRIDVQSVPGQGTTFTLRLPAAERVAA